MDFLIVSLPTASRLPKSSAELLAGAKPLVSQSGGALIVAVLGRELAEACADAASFGADRVYAVESEILVDHDADVYLQALHSLISMIQPGVVLLSDDAFTAELAPRLAYRLGTGVVTACVSMALTDSGDLVFTRPVYGGRVMAEMVVIGTPRMATVTPHSFDPLPRDDSRRVEVCRLDVRLEPKARQVTILDVQREDTDGARLDEARVIVSGGRGLGEATGFEYLEQLAGVLGAVVGSSRPPVDLGWAPMSIQVGQTGKNVGPELYIAVGISGASQHVAGIRGAKHIVVVNNDPEAPFFRVAELGVVADYRELLPVLTEKLKAML